MITDLGAACDYRVVKKHSIFRENVVGKFGHLGGGGRDCPSGLCREGSLGALGRRPIGRFVTIHGSSVG